MDSNEVDVRPADGERGSATWHTGGCITHAACRDPHLAPTLRTRPSAAGAALWLVLLLGACGGGGDSPHNGNSVVGGVCGDGVIDPGEACDDGAANSDTAPDACRTDCRQSHCGDGTVDSGEQCDDGAANSDRLRDACRTHCALPSCGDGIPDLGETCDDGNRNPGDGCSADCSVEPHFECTGVPSQCACAAHYYGAQCVRCRVLVSPNGRDLAEGGDGQHWDTALRRVQEGIDLAAAVGPRCDVWLAEGTYRVFSYGAANTVTLRSHVALLGGFTGVEETPEERGPFEAHPTVLHGQKEGATSYIQRVLHVVTAENTEDATLQGITVQGGFAGSGLRPEDQVGAGIFAVGSRIALDHCVLQDHVAGQGAALYAYGSQVSLIDTVIRNSHASEGGGIYAWASTVTLMRSTISHCTAGKAAGILGVVQSTVDAQASVFFANRAYRTETANNGGVGGGILASGGTAVQCTFVWNEANHGGAAAGLLALLENSVLWNNGGASTLFAVDRVRYSQGQVTADPTPRNDSRDPGLVRLPRSVATAALDGLDCVTLPLAGVQVGDLLDVGGDDIPRAVTSVSATEVCFTPGLSERRIDITRVEVWDAAAGTVQEDLRPAAGSPCIDTADDTVAPPRDRNGVPWSDVPGVGTPGTSADRGAYEFVP